MHQNVKRNRSGQSRNQSSKMPGDCVMKNVRRMLEIAMPAAMPCRIQHNKHREICRTVGQHKTKYARIFEADESMRKRLEGTQHQDHEDHIARNGINSLNQYHPVHEFIVVPRTHENTRCNGSSGERMGNIGENTAWQLTKVRNKSEVIAEARNKGHTVHFASLMDLCHRKNSELEPKIKNTKVESYSEVTL